MTDQEKRRLLERAFITVLQVREKVGAHAIEASLDAVTNLIVVSSKVEIISDDKLADTMLDAAEMLRQLKISIDISGR